MMRNAIVVAVLGLAARVSAQNWPSFRGPQASGVADGSPTPVTWNVSTSQNVVWKTPIAGLAVSSPIVWGNRVFVSTAVSSDPRAGIKTGLYGDVQPTADVSKHSWRLIALDKRTGKVSGIASRPRARRRRSVIRNRARRRRRRSPTARRVIVSFGSEGLYAYDFDGKLLWKRDLGVLNAGWFYDPDYEWGFGSSPIIWKNLVIVQCDIQKNSFVAAFDVATGQPVWRTASRGDSVVVDAGDLRSERTRRARDAGDQVHARLRPGHRQGVVAAVGQFGDRDSHADHRAQPGDRVERLHAGPADFRHQARRHGRHHAQGRQTQNEFIAWSMNRGGPYIPTPVIYKDQLYVLGINGVLDGL